MLDLRKLLVLGLASASFALALGCDDDDDSATPTGGDVGGTGGTPIAGTGGEGGGGTGGEVVGGTGGEGGGGTGGEVVGGTGGEGGGGTGGEGGSEPTADTAAMGAVGSYGPAARVNAMEVPATAEDGIAAGCGLVSESQGSALAGIIAMAGAGGLNDYVNPNAETGDIELVILAQLAGWEEGKTGNETGTVDLIGYTGDYAESAFYIDPMSFVDGVEANGPMIHFANTSVTNAKVATPAGEFSLTLPIMEGFPLTLSLAQAQIRGDLTVEAPSYSVANGVLTGYVTRETLLTAISAAQTLCASEEAPEVCDSVGTFIEGDPETVLGMLTGFVPFDSKIVAGEPQACTDDCDAIGLCLKVGMEPVEIAGVAAAAK